MKFIDEAKIHVIAGKGGDGSAAFRREKFIPFGGPSGGDGGRGGSIWAEGDQNINTLVEFRYTRKFQARKGVNGGNKDRYGAAGEDILLRMPVGTVISDLNSGERLADLDAHGKRVLIAKGGKGGLGNLHFKSSTNRAPRQFTRGEEGEERELQLELKVLADVGLLGQPNAGKSTFIRAVSAARPKVADYPFTTLHPSLGVVRVDADRSFVVADIPGLIEGAAEGAGLGVRFLKHLARTRVLLHLVDIAPPDPDTDIVRESAAIVDELAKYSPELAAKTRWLVINKIDLLPDDERQSRIDAFASAYRAATAHDGPVFAIAAVSGDGCRTLNFAIMDELDRTRPAVVEPVPEDLAADSGNADLPAPIPEERIADDE